MNDENYTIGIDFGTTTTSVVLTNLADTRVQKLLGGGATKELPFPTMAAARKTDGMLVFGQELRERTEELSDTHYIVRSLKTFLGNHRTLDAGGFSYSGIDLASGFLAFIKYTIQKEHGIDIQEAAFAFPIDFDSRARRDLKRAAERAGIRMLGFSSEATAAYIALYGKLASFNRVMIADFGGGTLDITITDRDGRGERAGHAEYTGGGISEIAVQGEYIGGDDIDRELALRLHSRYMAQIGGSPSATSAAVTFEGLSAEVRDKLLSECERIKIEFSNGAGTASDGTEVKNISISSYYTTAAGEVLDASIDVDYALFRDIVMPLIRGRALRAVSTAMAKAGVTAASLDGVVLAGGSSNLLPYRQAMINTFGEDKVVIPDNAASAVAAGASVIATYAEQFYLNEDFSVQLSDGTRYVLFSRENHAVGSVVGPIMFSLSEDAKCANFIFLSGDKVAGRIFVKTKGFLEENIELAARINHDRTVSVVVKNSFISKDYSERVDITELTYHYDITKMLTDAKYAVSS